MSRRNLRIAAVLALLIALAAGYRWWSSPERQIRAILADVAAAFTHDGRDSGLEALAAAARLQPHLAEDVTLQAGTATAISGRDAAVTAAARIRSASGGMRVRFFDPRIAVTDEARASLSVTSEVTTRSDSGEDVVDVLQVTATLERTADRWVVTSARTASEEPQS